MTTKVDEIPITYDSMVEEYGHWIPRIGAKYLHVGGNIWEVTKYAYVTVSWNDDGRNPVSITLGNCIYLKCVSGYYRTDDRSHDIRVEVREFRHKFPEMYS